MIRLRQICLVAPDLRNAEEQLLKTLPGSTIAFKDPNVALFGLETLLIMLGGDVVRFI